MDKEEFKFPDEQDQKAAQASAEDEGFEIEVEDDTPEEDRGRQPVSPETVKQLEVETDDLDQYSKDAKDKLIKMKRVWHDERRAREAAAREREEAVMLAQKLYEENKRMRDVLSKGEVEYKEAKKDSAEKAIAAAKVKYKEAYESGDADKVLDAQEELTKAQLNLENVNKFKLSALQDDEIDVQTHQEPVYQQVQAAPRPDNRAMKWQENNPWFGQDEEMTASALGLHEKLKRNGVAVGSDEYYATLDRTMRKRFPENFGDEEVKAEPVRTKPSTVVAPATRSTSSNKIKLKTSQVLLAKKLGLTPEQYALELRKLEAQ